jgi:hypothetical protein
MRASRHPWQALWLVAGALAVAGCGGSGNDGAGAGSGNGTTTDQWAGFCTATFTENTPILDAFDEPMFTARAGDEFLLSDFSDSFGGRAELLYLTNAGPDSFEVKPSADGAWPFTSNCTIGQGVPYYAVFKSVSVFAEKELKTKICDLSEGAVLPAGTSGRGYSLAGSLGESTLYQVVLGPFSEQCQGLSAGYVSVARTQSFGSTTWLVPIAGIIGPE